MLPQLHDCIIAAAKNHLTSNGKNKRGGGGGGETTPRSSILALYLYVTIRTKERRHVHYLANLNHFGSTCTCLTVTQTNAHDDLVVHIYDQVVKRKPGAMCVFFFKPPGSPRLKGRKTFECGSPDQVPRFMSFSSAKVL